MNDAWQRKRGALNHDWLKNRFLVAHLRGFIARLMAREPDRERLAEFAAQDWPTWAGNSGDLAGLLETAEAVLSPRQLLDQSPLSASDAETREWLSGLVHALWLNRSGVRRTIADARAAFAEADRRYRELAPLLSHADALDVERLRQAHKSFQEFDAAVDRLTKCIHALPHKIQVV